MHTHRATMQSILLWALLPSTALAALPPEHAADRERGILETARAARKQANTVVDLTVRSVSKTARDTNDCYQKVTYTVTAVVNTVQRTVSKLEAGDTLRFSYATKQYREDTGCVGPRPYYDVLKAGDTQPAYLECSESGACTAVVAYGALWSDDRLNAALESARKRARPMEYDEDLDDLDELEPPRRPPKPPVPAPERSSEAGD